MQAPKTNRSQNTLITVPCLKIFFLGLSKVWSLGCPWKKSWWASKQGRTLKLPTPAFWTGQKHRNRRPTQISGLMGFRLEWRVRPKVRTLTPSNLHEGKPTKPTVQIINTSFSTPHINTHPFGPYHGRLLAIIDPIKNTSKLKYSQSWELTSWIRCTLECVLCKKIRLIHFLRLPH